MYSVRVVGDGCDIRLREESFDEELQVVREGERIVGESVVAFVRLRDLLPSVFLSGG
jgi:hypothetical protein